MPILITLLIVAFTSHAATPVPVVRTRAEQAVAEANLFALDSATRLERGLALLEQFPNDVAAGKEVQVAIAKLLPDAPEFFRQRYERLNNAASFYLYARATNFQLPEEQVAAWVEREPHNSFLWLCYMATEWHKEQPDYELVRERIEQSILEDPSRPEGYSFLGMFYDEQGDLARAREAYESSLIADSQDETTRTRLLDIYLIQRDAEAYFALINGIVPDHPIDVELATVGKPAEKVKPSDLRGHVSLLIYWSIGSEICINNSLVEINKAIGENKIKWPVYAINVGGNAANAPEVISETDRNGTRWRINFVQSEEALDLDLNAAKRPCIYVIGADGFVHALVYGAGHETDLLETTIWLSEHVQAGM